MTVFAKSGGGGVCGWKGWAETTVQSVNPAAQASVSRFIGGLRDRLFRQGQFGGAGFRRFGIESDGFQVPLGIGRIRIAVRLRRRRFELEKIAVSEIERGRGAALLL